MAFEELKEHSENIQEQAQAYIENTVAYYKLKSFKVAMKSVTMIVKMGLFFSCFLMILLFCSIAGASISGYGGRGVLEERDGTSRQQMEQSQ